MKDIFRKIWNFQSENLGEFVQTFEVPSLNGAALLEIRYVTNASWGSYEWDILEHKLIVQPDHEAVIKAFNIDLTDTYAYVDVDEVLYIELSELMNEYFDLYNEVSEELLEAVREYVADLDDLVSHYNDFNAFWADIKDLVSAVNTVETVKLNGSYDAIVRAGTNLIEVGCQRFELANIEAVVAAHKKLNP